MVENKLEDRDLIARQALQPLGYQVKTSELGGVGLQLALQIAPDVIIANLHLPDLSGKDLLVALQSQNVNAPVIVIADEGYENEVIQAFRLGAADFIRKPLREAEIVAATERVLQIVRARHERENLARRLEDANRQLETRVKELTSIFSLGKALTSATRLQDLHKIIVDSAVQAAGAHRGYLLTRSDAGAFILSAYFNLPQSLSGYLDRPFTDGISSLVALSGETLAMHGKPLERFNIARLGRAAMVVPIRAKKETIGLLVVINREAQPFTPSHQALLEGVADYASISMSNALLFRALEERARSLQEALNNTRQVADAP
ncbi:MAG TPA: response regulator [Anaerolineales bacterium]|nr:response regulator [Anaerolineales bacterium]